MQVPHTRLPNAQSEVAAAIRQRARDFTLVETPRQLQLMLQELAHADTLAIDCEGVNLGAPQGQLCLLQLAARQGSHAAASTSAAAAANGRPSRPSQVPTPRASSNGAAPAHTPAAVPSPQPSPKRPHGSRSPPLLLYVVDVHQLQWRAFHYKLDPGDPSSPTLKGLLEAPHIVKLVYDVRSDAANLSRQFDVRLKGAYDLQLAEVAVRQMRGVQAKWVLPLDKSLGACLPRSPTLDQDMLLGQHVAKHYHKGNRMQVWQERPLPEELLQYAVGDVRYLHLLADALNQHLPPPVVSKVRTATIMRTRMGDLPGLSRASAPEIVRMSDLRQLTQQARDVQDRRKG